MKKYIVTYHSPPEAIAGMENVTPEEMKKGMKPWLDWAVECGDNLVDLGTPLTNGLKFLPGDRIDKSDRQVSGYSIIQANNLDEVKSLIQGHPHLGWNDECEIEVHEVIPMPI